MRRYNEKRMKKLLLILTSAMLLSACGLSKTSSAPNYQLTDIKISPTTMDTPTPTQTPLAENITANIKTNKGTMKVALFPKIAPNTVRNFVELAKGTRVNPLTGKKVSDKPFYDGIIFHRVISGFMIQGGDPDGTGRGGPGYTVPAEIGALHERGSIAMARLSDEVNPKKDSSGSQFYIAHKDISFLDGQYTVFGKIDPADFASLKTLDAIASTATDGSDKPLQDVTIESITITEE
jgi:peptidyl-prolyl cis-trans isomerase A (cyclophilin A)